MRLLIRIALLLVVGIVVYNYFYGTSEEKAKSKEVFQKSGEAVRAIWDAVKSEKSKYDAGKYDDVMDKLDDAYKNVRERAKYVDEKVLRRLDTLESRKRELQFEIDELNRDEKLQDADAPLPGNKPLSKTDRKKADQNAAKAAELERRKQALHRALDSLIRDTDSLLEDAGQK